MNRRPKYLQEKAKKCQVEFLGHGRFLVTSTSKSQYVVRELGNGGFECECEWSQYHRTDQDPCSHVCAVEMALAESGLRSVSLWNSQEDADRQHRQQRQIGRGLIATYRKI